MWLNRLFFWRRRTYSRASFAPGGANAIDSRTVFMPLGGGRASKTYYEVAQAWAKERIRVRRVLLEILDGSRDIEDVRAIPADFQCEMGIWLRFVNPGDQAMETLDELRIWHAEWHSATSQIIENMILAGHFEHAQSALTERAGSWYYAGRKVDRLLEALWAKYTTQPIQDRSECCSN